MKIDVAFLPQVAKANVLSDTICIVLDIFRATSSMVTAFAHECKMIVPVLSLEEARNRAEQLAPVLLAGERRSIRIDGFDFGNSPFEFSLDKVKNRTIVMTTTNGTIAVKAAEGAFRTLIGSFLNAKAVCLEAKQYGKDILFICAGTDGLFSLEDALCAGLFVNLLGKDGGLIMTDAALGVRAMYNGAKESIAQMVSNSRNGRRLYDLGLETDVEYCLQTDLVDIVPQYREGKIIL